MDFKMIPYVNLENLQKPMQIHHPVVKDANYNLDSNHSKVIEFVPLPDLQHTFPGKKKNMGKIWCWLCLLFVTIFPIKCYSYYLKFNFSFSTCPPITQMLNWIRIRVFQYSSKALIEPEVRKTVYKGEKRCGGEMSNGILVGKSHSR